MADTSIYNHLLQRPKSVAEYDNEAAEGQRNKLLLQMDRMKVDEYTRGVERTNKLTGMLSSFKPGMKAEDQVGALTRGGFLDEGRKLAESSAKVNKDQRDAEKAELEGHFKKYELAGQIIGGVKDQATWELARQETARLFGPEAAAQMPAQYDPALVEQKRAQAMTTKDQLEQTWKAKGYDLDVEKFGEVKRNNQAQTATTMRGQNMTASSAAVGHRLKADENAINRAGIVGKRTQDVEMKLQDDYRAESKGFGETSTAMKKIMGAISTADKNPGSALAAGTAFMKILDPNSVVRESELGMALNASGWFDRATNVAATLQSGRIMTPTQQKNLKAAAEDLFEEAKAAQREVDGAYKKRATDYGADPERVIVNRGQNTGRGGANAPVRITTDAEHAKLPSGTLFVTPDGQTRRKP